MKSLVVLGATGSIGVNGLDVVRRFNRTGQAWRVVGLSAQTNLDLLKKQIIEFMPGRVVVGSSASADSLRGWIRSRKKKVLVEFGAEGLNRMAGLPQADLILSAVVGAVGLPPLSTALKAGKKVALANKEALVAAGPYVMGLVRRYGGELIPVDSEHSAIFQCLGGLTGDKAGRVIRRIWLTASGGAFYKRRGPLDRVSVEEALAHPTWKMGKKITVDCATLTNKGLEAIEAHYLFGVPLERIQIVIHPQSIVHSLVEFEDGSLLAQLSHPDMRLPIQYALTHPNRILAPVRRLELDEIRSLEFFPPDFKRFPGLALALSSGKRGGTWPTVFNAANETAVRSFLDKKISFTGIARVVKTVLDARPKILGDSGTLMGVLKADQWAREKAQAVVGSRKEMKVFPKFPST